MFSKRPARWATQNSRRPPHVRMSARRTGLSSPKAPGSPSPRTSAHRFIFALLACWATSACGATSPDAAFFTDPIRTIAIQVDESGLEVLKKNDRSYVHATVTDGTNVFRDVGIHLKGMGSFRPFNEKPSLSVKFDKYIEKQRFHGLTKLMLNNASQDGTYLAELLATQMFRDAGVPAARVTHAFVEVNGRALGLYVVIEAMNKEFLRQYFPNTRGNLYEAYLQDIDQKLDQDGGTDETQADLKRLLEVCQLTDRAERWRKMPDVLDVEAYLSHLTVELFTSHTDGYAMNRNNYRLYHDPSTDRFVFLAHGIDWAFANGGISIRPQRNTIVTRAILETPEGQRAYRARSRSLFTNVFQIVVLTNRVNEAVARLKKAARNPNEAKEFEGYGAEMRNRILARHKNISDQLDAPEPKPLQFGTNGVGYLSGWYPKQHRGEGAVFDQQKVDDRLSLHVRAEKGDTIASWRTKVLLEEGRYTLEGLARASHVVALTNKLETTNAVAIRISGEKPAKPLVGDHDWIALQHEFVVVPGDDEKEVVCELRARGGEVWFDLSSLKLIRRP
jgi:hypothetical protein